MDKWSELSVSPFFRGLPPEVLTDAAEAAQRREFARGEVLLSPQEFPRALGLVLEGRLEVTRGGMRMDTLGPGGLFGAASLFIRRDRFPTTLTARTAGCALLFPEATLAALMERHPLLARRYIGYLTDRVAFLSDRLDALGSGAAADKLLCYLRDAGGRLENPSCTRLASALSLSRASLYRAMDALERRGLLVREGKTIRLTSPNEE